jgi:peroxiredoxin
MDPVIPNGQPAPSFSLPDQAGEVHNLQDFLGRTIILNFWSAECPWSERADRALRDYLKEWGDAVALLPIASNSHEETAMIARTAMERGMNMVLIDADQHVADLYGTITTPHLFVLDGKGILRYQGGLDDANFRQRQATRHFLREAVEALKAGREPDPALTVPYGCAISRY